MKMLKKLDCMILIQRLTEDEVLSQQSKNSALIYEKKFNKKIIKKKLKKTSLTEKKVARLV